MRSSDRPRDWGSHVVHALVALLALWLIAGQRAGLAQRFTKLRDATDNFLLPSPDVTLVASLGYRSALADFVFAHVLVSHGIHFHEKRLFENVGDYLDVINRLDPKFRDPYYFADALLTIQPKVAPTSYYYKARDILARGVKELPYDQDFLNTAGSFMAYVAPPQLPTDAEREDFKRIGAGYLLQACNLIGTDKNIPFHCIAASNLLTKQGNREAAKAFLNRLLVMSDDEELHDLVQRKLQSLSDDFESERARRHERRYRAVVQRDDMLFVSRMELDALGPATDTVACAGRDSESSESCAASWRRLAEHDQGADGADQ